LKELEQPFKEELARVTGVSFPATDKGYEESFCLIDALQDEGKLQGLTLSLNTTPIILTRALPPSSSQGLVLIFARQWNSGQPIGAPMVQLPQLSILRIGDLIKSDYADFELKRQREIEKFRLELLASAGKAPMNRDMHGVISDWNGRKTRLRLDFAVKDGRNLRPVRIQHARNRIQVITAEEPRTQLFYDKFFPQLYLLANT
jgi:hypothetical protein